MQAKGAAEQAKGAAQGGSNPLQGAGSDTKSFLDQAKNTAGKDRFVLRATSGTVTCGSRITVA